MLSCTIFQGLAQLLYSPEMMRVNSPSGGAKDVVVSSYNGLYWRPSSSTFLKIDLRGENTCMSGSNECVNFFDKSYGNYVGVIVGDIFYNSDSRAKENIRSLDNTSLKELNPVSFKWNDKASDVLTPESEGTLHYGFLAQEIESLYPGLVSEDAEGNKLVNYTGLLPILIKSLQNLDYRVSQQEAEIESLLREYSLYTGNSPENLK